MSTVWSSEWVTLKGDVSLPLAAVACAIDLYADGWRLSRQADRLLVSPTVTETQPAQLLSPEARAAIQTCKPHLLMVVDYLNATTYGSDGLFAATTAKGA